MIVEQSGQRDVDVCRVVNRLCRFLRSDPLDSCRSARPLVAIVFALDERSLDDTASELSAMMLFVVIGLAAIGWSWRQSTIANSQLELSLQQTRRLAKQEAVAKRAIEASLKDLQHSAYVDGVQLAFKQWSECEIESAKRTLASLPKRLRHWEWGFLSRNCNQARLTCRGHDGVVNCVDFFGSGKSIISGGLDGTIRIWGASDGKPNLTVDVGVPNTALDTDRHDDLTVVGCSDGSIHIYATGDWSKVFQLAMFDEPIIAVRVNPDGSTVAVASAQNCVAVVDMESRSVVSRFAEQQSDVRSISYQQHGRFLLVASESGALETHQFPQGIEDKTIANHQTEVVGLVRREGDAFILLSLSRWRQFRSSGVADRLKGIYYPKISSGVMMPSIRAMVTAGIDGSVVEWDLRKPDHRRAVYRGHEGPVTAIAAHPSRNLAATAGADGTVRLWEIDASPFSQRRPVHHDITRGMDISSHGRWVQQSVRHARRGRDITDLGRAREPSNIQVGGRRHDRPEP